MTSISLIGRLFGQPHRETLRLISKLTATSQLPLACQFQGHVQHRPRTREYFQYELVLTEKIFGRTSEQRRKATRRTATVASGRRCLCTDAGAGRRLLRFRLRRRQVRIRSRSEGSPCISHAEALAWTARRRLEKRRMRGSPKPIKRRETRRVTPLPRPI